MPDLKTPDGRYLIFVDGDWRASDATLCYDNVNPAQPSTVLGRVSESTSAEVDDAVVAAGRAFPAWRAVSGNIKTKLFLKTAQLFERDRQTIVQTMTREMGKTLFDSRLDLDEAIGVIECVAPQGLSLKGETYQRNIDGLVMESRLEPRGVAAIITPFNFPVAIPVAQIVSALVTGNTVVWKPSHLVPESSQAVARIIEEAFAYARERFGVAIPGGAFNMVTGDRDAGDRLVRHASVRCVSFTGSKTVGDAVDSVASGLGKRVMKEVGGVNIFYVHAEADIDRAARNFVYGKTITAGQRCTSIQEVCCDEVVYDAFLSAVLREAEGIVYGDGASKALAEADRTHSHSLDTPRRYSLPPLVSHEQQERVADLVVKSVSQGALIRLQQNLPDATSLPEPLSPPGKGEQEERNLPPSPLPKGKGSLEEVGDSRAGTPTPHPEGRELAVRSELPGYHAAFTILENVDSDNILYATEVFGPVAVFRQVSGVNEAIRLINERIGIVACIDSRNKDVSEHFIQSVLRTRVDDGRHGTGAFWATRFGGDRGAGSGNPALDENMAYGYVLWKTIYRSYTPIVGGNG